MRNFAWVLVVIGILIGAGSFIYADQETKRREDAWLEKEKLSFDHFRLERTIRMLNEGMRPAWVIVSPWPGVITGACVTAFGVILLAIRRPEKTSSSSGG